MPRLVTVVTGASAGIGAAFARRLARDRRDLVLTARRTDRLEALHKELAAAHGVKIDVISIDLGEPGAGTRLASEIEARGLEVDWLVNNAGFGTAGRVDRLPVARELEQIRVNVRAPVELTGRLLPGMVQRGRGAVINLSSVAGFAPMAYMATYAATKAFVLAWTEALAADLQGTGVHALAVCPGFTRTEFQDIAHVDVATIPRFLWMNADDVVERAVAAVGRQSVLVTGTLNQLTAAGLRLAPRGLVARVTASTNASRVRSEP